MISNDHRSRAAKLIRTIDALEQSILTLEAPHTEDVERIAPAFQPSAQSAARSCVAPGGCTKPADGAGGTRSQPTRTQEGVCAEWRMKRATSASSAGQRHAVRQNNKGPHIVEVVRLLTGILSRMSAHQSKKRAAAAAVSFAFSKLD